MCFSIASFDEVLSRMLSFDYTPDWNHAQSQKLVASDGYSYDNFGTSVAVHDSVVVVGAVSRYKRGLVYVFERNDDSSFTTWKQYPFALTGAISDATDFYGWSLDVYGDTIAVGAYMADPSQLGYASDSYGLVYMYSRKDGMWEVCLHI